MEKQNDQKRTGPISYRPPVELEAEFWLRVERSGLSKNAFITQAIFGKEPARAARKPVVEKQVIGHLLAQTARLHDDLREIALVAGSDANVALQLEQILTELVTIRNGCFKAMGRQS